MIEKQKNAIIVSLNNKTSEIKQLAHSLNYHVVKEFIQHRKTPDTNSYIGPGKIEEIKEIIESYKENIDLVIINGILKPSQWFILEKKLNTNVYDRIRLILEIFAERAERKEAKLQVKLAQLQYERPFVRELIHRTRAGEHPGFMAGGEYQVDDYYEMIKRQMKKIREDLEKIRKSREIHRQNRYKSGFYLVSLAGYTNAGKSSLLNLLSNEKVKVEGKLFSTLSTITRKIENKTTNKKKIPILLTDTVGFIQDLPSWIIDAFHSTLEEIKTADVVILVADISEKKEAVEKKLKVSLKELQEIGVTAPIIIALNKIDTMSNKENKELTTKIKYIQQKKLINNKKYVPISVQEKKNISTLLNTVYDLLPQKSKIKIHLPINRDTQAFISHLYEKTHITHIKYTNNTINIDIECNEKIKNKIISKCKKLNGSIISS